MDSIVFGVLIAAGTYSLGMIGLCVLLTRKWYMILLFILNVLVFAWLGLGYLRKWPILQWLGQQYDICYWMCKFGQVFIA